MRCEICGGEVPQQRVKFLLSEGREIVCIACQKKLEEEGSFKVYKGVIVTDREGKYYDFVPTKADVPTDPFQAYGGLRKLSVGADE